MCHAYRHYLSTQTVELVLEWIAEVADVDVAAIRVAVTRDVELLCMEIWLVGVGPFVAVVSNGGAFVSSCVRDRE